MSTYEIQQLTFLLKNLIEKLNPVKSSRLEELEEEIKKIDELKHLFVDDPETNYEILKCTGCCKLNHLQKCVILTSKFKILEEYIDLYLAKHPEEINHKNDMEVTALMIAACNSNFKSTERTVEMLLKHNGDVNLKDWYGWTALMHAVNDKCGHVSENTVKLLLDYEADIFCKNDDGETALELSLYSSSEDVVKLLLNKMDNCDIVINNVKLIKILYDEEYSDDIINIVLQKGAKLSDIYGERIIKLIEQNISAKDQ